MYRFSPPGKERPVLIFTRESALDYLSTATVSPVTSIIRGVPSEVKRPLADGRGSETSTEPRASASGA
jgi:mRNA-degrading endonuclease toxin of MazEF toxin-antitoxin module